MNNISLVPVDFGNRDDDGAVRLVTRGTVEYLEINNIVLEEGMKLMMTDGEVRAEGICAWRQGIWVAVVRRWME
jgi:hypothetical protein